MAEDGFDVAINDIPANSLELEQLAEEIKSKFGKASSVHPGDVSEEDLVRGMVEQVVETYGHLDVVSSVGNLVWYYGRRRSKAITDGCERGHCKVHSTSRK